MFGNMKDVMQKAQEMQTKMQEMQTRFEAMEVTGEAGGGMITAVVNCRGDIRAIDIDKGLLKADEKEILEDLIIAAFKDAKSKAEKVAGEEMNKITGGVDLGNLSAGLGL